WGLLFSKITQKAVWYTTGISFLAAILVKVVMPDAPENAFLAWLLANSVAIEAGVGVLVPLLALTLFELMGRKPAADQRPIQTLVKRRDAQSTVASIASFPARLLAYSIGFLSLMMYALAFTAGDRALLVGAFGMVLSTLAVF